jgi:hypothetical protein
LRVGFGRQRRLVFAGRGQRRGVGYARELIRHEILKRLAANFLS